MALILVSELFPTLGRRTDRFPETLVGGLR